MPPSLTIRTLAPHEWRLYRDLRVRALTDAPEAFGSTAEAEQSRPDEAWAARLASGADRSQALPLVAEHGGEPVGLAWGRMESPLAAHVYQMWVAPGARGLGAGRGLLDAIVGWAREAGAQQILLDVTEGNGAAERLYARAGFVPTGETEPLRPGSAIISKTMRLDLAPGRQRPLARR